MIDLDKRLDSLESNLVELENKRQKLITDNELDAVVSEVNESIGNLRDRIRAIKNQIAIVESIIATAQGSN